MYLFVDGLLQQLNLLIVSRLLVVVCVNAVVFLVLRTGKIGIAAELVLVLFNELGPLVRFTLATLVGSALPRLILGVFLQLFFKLLLSLFVRFENQPRAKQFRSVVFLLDAQNLKALVVVSDVVHQLCRIRLSVAPFRPFLDKH